ncbi:MAG: hypothetical protein DELT_01924 [Desulfovibrio sp.]
MSVLRFACAGLIAWGFVFCGAPFTAANAATANAPTALFERVAGKRFSATVAYSAQRQDELSHPQAAQDAAIVAAEMTANAEAMQYLMRALVSLPEVRVAGNTASTTKPPNLLALAHASAETEILLISRSKKKSEITVTVTFAPPEQSSSIENRVRETLIIPERLALYEEAVLREKKLLAAYAKATQPSSTGPRYDPAYDSGKVRSIIGELQALKMFKRLLPGWNGIWAAPAEARAVLQNALQLAPESPLLHNALGDASLQLGRSQEAVEEQTAAIKIDPAFARAHHSRGAAHLALGHLALAEADFSEAIRLSPHTAAYRRDRGMARHLLGETVAMCRDLYEACTLGDCEKLSWATANAFCSSKSFR